MTSLVGQTLDHYRLAEHVGTGGMATVYRAIDLRNMNEVAVKILSPAIGADRSFIERFRREAEILHRRLKHPNIVPVLAYGQVRGLIYLAMPFIRGGTLHDRIARGQVTLEGSTRWVTQVAAALDFAHRAGVIHRDVKPSNVMINESGNVLLADFGLARLVEGTGTLTGSKLMGTPAFVSPEQGRGAKLDGRSDQYSLGVMLFQIATGHLPFDADAPMATVLMHIQEPVPRPRSLNPSLPPAVEAVILKSLEKNPARRFPTATALAEAYQAAVAGTLLSSVDEPTVLSMALPPRSGAGQAFENRTLARPRRRSTLTPIVLGIVAALILIGVMLSPPVMGLIRSAFLPEPTAGLPLPTPAATTLPLPAGPTRNPEPFPSATAAVAAGCPAIALLDFEREGSEVGWSLDNAGDQPVTIVSWQLPWAPDNPLLGLRLGENTLWELPAGVTPGPDVEFSIPRDERSSVPAQSVRPLRLTFSRSDASPIYFLELTFDNGCTLHTRW
jgi:serine/threonine-protein kinase